MKRVAAFLFALMVLCCFSSCAAPGGDGESVISQGESSAPESIIATDDAAKTTTSTKDDTTAANDDKTTVEQSVSTTTSKDTAVDTTIHTTTTTTTKTDSVESTVKTTTTTTATTTVAPLSEKEAFLAQRKTTVTGSPENKNTWSYLLGITGMCVREAEIDSGRGGELVEIAHITDIHFNKLNDRDFQENNPSVMSTYAQREHLANGASGTNAEKCMKFASFFDQTVITGDTLDYLTWGALEMVQELIWKPYPETLIALGNHEPVRIMGLGNDVSDPTTPESRYKILQDNWKHDIYYTAKIVKNKVMVIQMDNSQNHFHDHQVPKLKADIEKARQKGYTVLLFMHIPLKAGAVAQGATQQVRDLIFNNADVVRGIFTGHTHHLSYYEMPGKTPSGQAKKIPQYVGAAAFLGRGNVTWIKVK